ncbi:hypothetical protein SADUNF_Sadunf09G0053900 [Salix dunnii]|uniref:F-box domain-containing protein n=1 Tax=Salix dunnii TaxID=1413687 RepID=A0A835JQL6_9ROSI|nr:hypothetical protein SADUNF_Sadunf09G0053900 [Salix dunnii]
MLLYIFITCFSFILFLKPLSLKPLPPWASEIRLLSFWFSKDLFLFSYLGSLRNTLLNIFCINIIPLKTSIKKMSLSSRAEKSALDDETGGMSVLDLPELALECVLERLPPAGLCSMAGVCTSLRERCVSDHLWEKHMKHKWGRVIGPAAYREWQWHLASRNYLGSCKHGKPKGFMRLLSIIWPSSWSTPKIDPINNSRQRSSLPVNSIMSCYLALETGKFWFPAQVFNRENGHVGFMLSCYDAELNYDPRTDTFQARYPPHGRRAIATESGVPWERLRAPSVDTSPHDLHISECLHDLLPGDHIEIQWRRNKEFPYGLFSIPVGGMALWVTWSHVMEMKIIVGVVTAVSKFYLFFVASTTLCSIYHEESDTVVLEFHQYTPGSRWRSTTINRKDHREEGNEADGFYGGIRKLFKNEEISRWKRLWPTEVLE